MPWLITNRSNTRIVNLVDSLPPKEIRDSRYDYNEITDQEEINRYSRIVDDMKAEREQEERWRKR